MRFTETYTSGTHTSIKFDIYQPNVILRYKGIIQIHHGLCEYSERYKKFAEYLSHEGFIVVVSDMELLFINLNKVILEKEMHLIH